MLYARCSFCGYTDALTCSGAFMPHMTVYVSLTARGPTCPTCGPLQPYFVCPWFHQNYLYIPGYSSAPQPGYAYAPVVQAQAGASEHSLSKAFGEILGHMAGEFGKGAAQAMFGQPA
jgi:hypothetical protein